jgi:hypothetical protein
MNKIIAAIIGLVLVATPALACFPGDPDCRDLYSLNDATIDTYFWGKGYDTEFNDMLVIDEFYDDDVLVEDIWTDGELMVTQNIRIEEHRHDPTEVIVNKFAIIDPWCDHSANAEKYVFWDEGGEVYREAWLDDVYSMVNVEAQEGTFIDDIKYYGTLTLFESVGLHTETICKMPEMPEPPEMPECDWCIPRA